MSNKNAEVSFIGQVHYTGGGGAYIPFPYDTLEIFGKKNQIPVVIHFNEQVKYVGRIANMGKGPMVPILKSIREQLNLKEGSEVAVRVQLDTSERKVDIPNDLKAVFEQNNVLEAFLKLSYTNQKEMVVSYTEAKREETRLARLNKIIDKLLS
jgi:uncharacterized protein YdeI (YjbR/CyaY-like superfamily)